jgi:Ca2+-binding RTX toxin-like protein
MRKSFGALVLVTAALVPGVARGAEVGLVDPAPLENRSFVFFEAESGETNNLTVSLNGSAVIFNEPVVTITTTTPSRCAITNSDHTATCTPTGSSPPVPDVNVFLSDLNDTLVNNAPVPPDVFNDTPFPGFFATGGSGDDDLTGSSTGDFFFPGTGSDTARGLGGNDRISDENEFDYDPQPAEGVGDDHFFGGDGDDDLFGGGGNDELRGEAGSDTLDAWTGNNTTDGGPGIDAVTFFLPKLDTNGDLIDPLATDQGAHVVLNHATATTGNGVPGQNDTIIGIEDVVGTKGADEITGSALGNMLDGAKGNDTIIGGAGPDNVRGGENTDSLDTVDNEPDRADCGGQLGDTAMVDSIDQVLHCPTVTGLTVVPPALLDTTPPSTTLGSVKIKRAARKATFRFSSNEPGSSFLCKIDKKAFASCSSPKTYKRLKTGKHKFQVQAKDAAGNIDASPVVKKFRI